MVAIFTFVGREIRNTVIIFCYPGGQFGFFAGAIADFLGITNPTFGWFVDTVIVLGHCDILP